MKIRLLQLLLLGAMAVSFSSCATSDMIAKANGTPGPLDSPNQPPTNPNPMYYALVPVVLPFDLVAWPFQYAYLQNRQQYTGVPQQGLPPPRYQQQAPRTGYQGQPPPGYPTQQ
ncbi:hypothetical protein BH09VER1_BH09VER1_44460 [soil metagenome]